MGCHHDYLFVIIISPVWAWPFEVYTTASQRLQSCSFFPATAQNNPIRLRFASGVLLQLILVFLSVYRQGTEKRCFADDGTPLP